MTESPLGPEIGGLYWVRTRIMWSQDVRLSRPVVVLEVPFTAHGMIVVATRTKDTTKRGVFHRAAPELGLSLDGVFVRIGHAYPAMWTTENVSPLGQLDQAVLADVMKRFVE